MSTFMEDFWDTVYSFGEILGAILVVFLFIRIIISGGEGMTLVNSFIIILIVLNWYRIERIHSLVQDMYYDEDEENTK